MTSFGGLGTSRGVSYTRTSTNASGNKKNHVETLRKEREARAAQRKRESATTKLQAAGRSLINRREAARACRDEFDSITSSLSSSIAVTTASRLVRLFTFFFSPSSPEQPDHLLRLLDILNQCEAHADETTRYSSQLIQATDGTTRWAFFLQMQKLLIKCVIHMLRSEYTTETKYVTSTLQLLQQYTDISLWQFDRELQATLALRLVQNGVFQALTKCMLPEVQQGKTHTDSKIFGMAAQCIQNLLYAPLHCISVPTSVSDHAKLNATPAIGISGLEILCLSNNMFDNNTAAHDYWSICCAKNSNTNSNTSPPPVTGVVQMACDQMERILSRERDDTDTSQVIPYAIQSKAHQQNFFYNYLKIVSAITKMAPSTENGDKQQITAAMESCIRLLGSIQTYVSVTDIIENAVHSNNSPSPTAAPTTSTTNTSSSESSLFATLCCTCKSMFECAISVEESKRESGTTQPQCSTPQIMNSTTTSSPFLFASTSNTEKQLPCLGSLCSFLGALIGQLLASRKPTKHQLGKHFVTNHDKLIFELLSPIAFAHSSKLLLRMWTLIKNTPRWNTTNAETTASVITIFTRATAYYLNCVDEEEFFNKQPSLSLDVAQDLVDQFKVYVFNLIMGVHVKNSLLKDSTSSLLQELHVLDSRRPFCKTGVWIVQQSEAWPTAIRREDFERYRPTVGMIGQEEKTFMQRTITALHKVPFVVPFSHRVLMFHNFIEQDDETLPQVFPTPIRVRRQHLFEDAYSSIHGMDSTQLKCRINIEFVGADGLTEAGFGEGVSKEFLIEVSKVGFSKVYGLFQETPSGTLYPNPAILSIDDDAISKFKFLGRMLGKALHERVLVEIPLAGFFRNLILGVTNTFSDLKSLDETTYKNLLTLKYYTGNVEDLSLDFTVADEEYGKTKVRELLPNGHNVAVTDANRMHYILAMYNYRLNIQMTEQAKAFREGLSDVIDLHWLQMFSSSELQHLISGAEDEGEGLDIDDWRAHTVYASGYHEDHQTVHMFWDVVRTWDTMKQRSLLKFTTSVGRAPLLGFKYMNPPFCIQRYMDPDNPDRLPSAATCMSILKLPPYQDKKTMEEKLLYAVNSNAGFDLS